MNILEEKVERLEDKIYYLDGNIRILEEKIERLEQILYLLIIFVKGECHVD